MGYTVPTLQDLLDGISRVRSHYLEKKKEKKEQPNPLRLQLLDILEAAGEWVKSLDETVEPKPSETELKEILLGAYLFCIESIATKYRMLNPSFAKGWLFNSGSNCYDALLSELGITQTNVIDDKHKPYYLNRFYNCAFDKYPHQFAEKLHAKDLNEDTVNTQVFENIRAVYKYIDGDAKKLLKAIPTESAIDEKMVSLPKDYNKECRKRAKSSNPERDQLARLVTALCKVVNRITPAQSDEELDKHFLSRRQRIKMGMLIYVMQSIAATYKARSPRGNSVLYDLCCEALNIKDHNELDNSVKVACLSAYETFITDSKNVTELEFEINRKEVNVIKLPSRSSEGISDEERLPEDQHQEHKSEKEKVLDAKDDDSKPLEFELPEIKQQICIDPVIRKIRKETGSIIDTLNNDQPKKIFSPVTIGMATLGGLIGAAPGYGAGYVIGYAIGQTNGAVGPKLGVTKVTDFAMTVILGDAGQYLGYFASNMVVDATLERAFAKVFEALGTLVGAATGGVIGLVIYDLSVKTLMNLCKLYLHLHDNIHPDLARNADPKFIQGLLSSPPEIFSDDNKAHLQQITKKKSIFSPVEGKIAEDHLEKESQLGAVKNLSVLLH